MLEYLDHVNLANPPTEHQSFARKLTHKKSTKMVHFLNLANPPTKHQCFALSESCKIM
jgi:hypothetical protein